MAGRDLHDAGVCQRKGRIRRGGVPLGNLRLGNQALEVILYAIVQRTVDLGESAGMAHVLNQILVLLIAEAAGPRFPETAKLLATRGVNGSGPGGRSANGKGARVAQARPSEALPAAVPRLQQIIPFGGR